MPNPEKIENQKESVQKDLESVDASKVNLNDSIGQLKEAFKVDIRPWPKNLNVPQKYIDAYNKGKQVLDLLDGWTTDEGYEQIVKIVESIPSDASIIYFLKGADKGLFIKMITEIGFSDCGAVIETILNKIGKYCSSIGLDSYSRYFKKFDGKLDIGFTDLPDINLTIGNVIKRIFGT